MRKFCQTVDLFAMGGGTYGLIEVLWRGYTHWSMALLGGVLFLLIGAGNRLLPEGTPLLIRGLAGAGVITAAEFAAGCILNLGLGLAVWDYSGHALSAFWGRSACLTASFGQFWLW